jgi:OmcA/MtrC family decaheme c-type cytochrome
MQPSFAPRPQHESFSAVGAVLALALLAGCNNSDSSTPSSTVDRGENTSTVVARTDDAPGVVIAITALAGASGEGGSFQVGDRVSVTFTIKKNNGSWWNIGEFASGRILLSGPSFNYQRVIPEKTDLVTASVSNADGSYTYTFADPIPATYASPLNDTTSFTGLDGELAGQALVAGTYTVGMYAYWNYTVDSVAYRDAGNATSDFRFGGVADLAPREVVKQDNCNQCHVSLRAHGGIRRDVKLCLLCHTSGSEDKNVATVEGGTPGASVDFRVMIHKIHNAAHLPSLLGVATNEDGSRNYSATPKRKYEGSLMGIR